MIQHLLYEDRVVDEFDFGRDRETFKKTWASREHTRCGILAFDRRTLGGWRGLLEQRIFEWRDRLGEVSRPLRARLAALRRKRSEEHTSELQSLMRISYAVFCLKKKNK